jgi:hypothetical protein
MAQSSYANYLALRGKLRRLSSTHAIIGKSYCALTTLVLDTALRNSGYLPKESYYGSPFEQPGLSYKDWIEKLKKAGVLAPFKDDDKTMEKSDWIRFKPGPITLPYVNKEKAHQQEMASMRDVYESEARVDAKKVDRTELEETKRELQETKSKLEDTNRVVAKIAVAVRNLQLAKQPQITDDKIALQRQAEHELEENTRALVN